VLNVTIISKSYSNSVFEFSASSIHMADIYDYMTITIIYFTGV